MIGVDEGLLTARGPSPTSIVVALPRGTRLDTRARARQCTRAQAAGGGCPKASRIGLGLMVVRVSGFLMPGGETEVTWSIGAFLGTPLRPGDAASVVLRAQLLGADRVAQLLAPLLGAGVPGASVTSGRVIGRAAGPYGPEVRFAQLPGGLSVPPSVTATPTRFELAIGAVRRTRQDFVRHVRVRTLEGYRTREIPDHRLVGHDLLRAPARCAGAWPYELRVGFPGGVERRSGRVACTDAQSTADA